MDVRGFQARLLEILEGKIGVLEEILKSPRLGPITKLKVFEFITSRIPGLGPIKTSLTQTLTAEMDPKALLALRDRLVKEREELSRSLKLLSGNSRISITRDET